MLDAEARVQPIIREFDIGLSEEMYKDGFQHITNIDISPTVIKQLQERYKEDSANMKCRYKQHITLNTSPSYGRKKTRVQYRNLRHRHWQRHSWLDSCNSNNENFLINSAEMDRQRMQNWCWVKSTKFLLLQEYTSVCLMEFHQNARNTSRMYAIGDTNLLDWLGLDIEYR